jgi:dTMP kinase
MKLLFIRLPFRVCATLCPIKQRILQTRPDQLDFRIASPLLYKHPVRFVAHTSYPGKLIAVEGLDGSGKSTQIHLVRRWLELQGLRVFFTAWNSSSLVKPATSKGKITRALTPTTFSLIHATDFADRYERSILPLLRAGYIVLCDRYIYTAFARDVVRGVSREWVEQLYSFAVKPDLTLFFRAPLEVSLKRILDGRPELKYHEAGLDMGWSTDPYESFRIFQGRMLDEYESMVKSFGFTVVNSARDIHIMQEEVRQWVREHLDLAQFKWCTAE